MSDVQDQHCEVGFLDLSPHGAQERAIEIRRVDLEAPWRWLSAGWRDLLRMPRISLGYGAVFSGVSLGLWVALWGLGWQALMLPLAGGFMLIGPVLAAGLYEGSRRLEAGQTVEPGDVNFAGFAAQGQLWLLGLTLMLIYMFWLQIALLLFMLAFGERPFPPLAEFVPFLLFSLPGVTLLVAGTAIGAALAALVFAICVVSAPMLMARPVGISTAIRASVRAALANPEAMALWAALIAGFTAFGLATLGVGLVVIFPLIGHATWHAYRDVVGWH
ncbi:MULTISPECIES: DUF2189 domain-containing protein [Rhodomicrobium]|uniref:DUF2189 domain-containing protein n=1 Tax=Rhodomicrobium TaxID=1068 RepID=UPI0014824F0F|nr:MULTISPECIES: DUF2189 domain-containing protein [Rhodomicrobium]